MKKRFFIAMLLIVCLAETGLFTPAAFVMASRDYQEITDRDILDEITAFVKQEPGVVVYQRLLRPIPTRYFSQDNRHTFLIQ